MFCNMSGQSGSWQNKCNKEQNWPSLGQNWESILLAGTRKGKLFLVVFTNWYREKDICQVNSGKANVKEHVILPQERYYTWVSM